MAFCFRLTFRSTTGFTTQDSQIELGIPSFPKLIVAATQGSLSSPLFIAIRSCGFPSSEQAKHKGRVLSRALMLAGIRRRFGIDVGFDETTRMYSEEVKEAVRSASGQILKDTVHGLDVFEEGDVVYVGGGAVGSSTLSVEAWESDLAGSVLMADNLSEPQKICLELLSSSFFVLDNDVKFIIRIAAIESLCIQQEAPRSLVSAVDQVLLALPQLRISDEEAETISQPLRNLRKRQSVRSAYKEKITSLLDQQRFKEFDETLYPARSDFLHEGKGRGVVGRHAEDALTMAVELLEADLQSGSTDGNGHA